MAELDLLIGKRLQIARKALGFKSARSFARQYAIPESTYSQHETGKRSLNPTVLVAYCKWLNITPGWLISGEAEHINSLQNDKNSIKIDSVQNVKVLQHPELCPLK